MRVGELARSSVLTVLVAVATLGAAGQAFAFDEKVFDDKSGVKPKSSPWEVFQFGFSAYKNGHKEQAVEAYKYAAENGQIGATWKLARMYAEGDGVAQDDYAAYKFFSEIAEQDVEPGSPEESYVSDALVALGDYLKQGIPGSPVSADPVTAQEYFTRAAANYRNPNAQYELGKMFLKGEGGAKASVRQAACRRKGARRRTGNAWQPVVPERQGGAWAGHDDGRAFARDTGRSAVDSLHAGRGFRGLRRGRSAHRHLAGR
jgi:hypothetical protein